jgi:hypothetical protein
MDHGGTGSREPWVLVTAGEQIRVVGYSTPGSDLRPYFDSACPCRAVSLVDQRLAHRLVGRQRPRCGFVGEGGTVAQSVRQYWHQLKGRAHPICGPADVLDAGVRSGYQGTGTWTHSYFTQP